MPDIDKLKPLIKRIDELCTPIFKLGDEKGVKSKDLEKKYTKQPLADLVFSLFSCLYYTKVQLEAAAASEQSIITDAMY